MRASTIRRHAAITAQISGAIVAGDSQLTIAIDDPNLFALVRDFTSEVVGGEQDGITQADGRDLYLWTVEPTKERGPVRISLVWVHGRQASKATEDDVIDLATARAKRDHETAESRLEHLLRESLKPCAVCNLTLGTHTRAERAVCDAIANTKPQPPHGA